jgi:hypothetical protein
LSETPIGASLNTTELLCMAIPDFDAATGNLPPGIHDATWDEVMAAFGSSARRAQLLDGLYRALQALRAAGCPRVYIDGSFATSKASPGDFDGCWEAQGVDWNRLDPVLRAFTRRRAAQKAKYGGELFIANAPAAPGGTAFLDFFQTDKATGDPKGIVALDLRGLP